jgi:predicted GH43/DUF377 family glycosyl hydrolase
MDTHTLARQLSLVLVVALVVTIMSGAAVSRAQNGNNALLFYEDNPVLTVGEEDEWDSAAVFAGDVVLHDGMYYMFYTGGTDAMWGPLAIGFATSADGMTWDKYEGNPVLTVEVFGAEPTPSSIVAGAVIVHDGTWMLFFSRLRTPGIVTGASIWRATASAPEGPWVVDETPVLEYGSARRWDNAALMAPSVVATDDGLCLFYAGFGSEATIGVATSSDGGTWTKYDDPDTTHRMFDESDPVIPMGDHGTWDVGFLTFPRVVSTGETWLMLYAGVDQEAANVGLGYATGTDCVTWTKGADSPLWSGLYSEQLLTYNVASITVDSTIWLYSLFSQEDLANAIYLAFLTPPGG